MLPKRMLRQPAHDDSYRKPVETASILRRWRRCSSERCVRSVTATALGAGGRRFESSRPDSNESCCIMTRQYAPFESAACCEDFMSLTIGNSVVSQPEVWSAVLQEIHRHDIAIAADEAFALFLGMIEGRDALTFPSVGVIALVILDKLNGRRGVFPGLDFERATDELIYGFETGSGLKGSLQHLASGAVKHVFRLNRYPDVAMAISRAEAQNGQVEKEHAILLELGKRELRIIRTGSRCFDSPSREALMEPGVPLIKNRRAFLIQYVAGEHVFPNHGIDPDPAKIPVRSSVFRKATRLGIMNCPRRLPIMIGDLALLLDHARQCTGCFVDLQGMIEKETGHFYLCDPSHRALERALKQESLLARMEALLEALRVAHGRLMIPTAEGDVLPETRQAAPAAQKAAGAAD